MDAELQGRQLRIVLGKTITESECQESFHEAKYSFLPKSVAEASGRAVVVAGKAGRASEVEMVLSSDAGKTQTLCGNVVPSKQPTEFVLVWDELGEHFVLERCSSTFTLRKGKLEGKKTAAAIAEIRATSAERAEKRAAAKAAAAATAERGDESAAKRPRLTEAAIAQVAGPKAAAPADGGDGESEYTYESYESKDTPAAK